MTPKWIFEDSRHRVFEVCYGLGGAAMGPSSTMTLRFQGLNNTFFLFGYVSSSIYTPKLIICYIVSQSDLLKYWFAMSFTLNLSIQVSTLFPHWFNYINTLPIKHMIAILIFVSRHCHSFCNRWKYELDGSLVNHWVSPRNVLKSCMIYFNDDTKRGLNTTYCSMLSWQWIKERE